MKTLKQIKYDYAAQQGFANWYELITYCNKKYLDHYITEVMILAQKQALQNASEKAPEMLEMLSLISKTENISNFCYEEIQQLIKQTTEL